MFFNTSIALLKQLPQTLGKIYNAKFHSFILHHLPTQLWQEKVIKRQMRSRENPLKKENFSQCFFLPRNKNWWCVKEDERLVAHKYSNKKSVIYTDYSKGADENDFKLCHAIFLSWQLEVQES